MSKSNFKPVKVSELFEGARVILTHPDNHYTIGPANPAFGSKFFCEGVVALIEVDKVNGKEVVYVKWDKGGVNNYKNNELSLVTEGRFSSIW